MFTRHYKNYFHHDVLSLLNIGMEIKLRYAKADNDLVRNTNGANQKTEICSKCFHTANGFSKIWKSLSLVNASKVHKTPFLPIGMVLAPKKIKLTNNKFIKPVTNPANLKTI